MKVKLSALLFVFLCIACQGACFVSMSSSAFAQDNQARLCGIYPDLANFRYWALIDINFSDFNGYGKKLPVDIGLTTPIYPPDTTADNTPAYKIKYQVSPLVEQMLVKEFSDNMKPTMPYINIYEGYDERFGKARDKFPDMDIFDFSIIFEEEEKGYAIKLAGDGALSFWINYRMKKIGNTVLWTAKSFVDAYPRFVPKNRYHSYETINYAPVESIFDFLKTDIHEHIIEQSKFMLDLKACP